MVNSAIKMPRTHIMKLPSLFTPLSLRGKQSSSWLTLYRWWLNLDGVIEIGEPHGLSLCKYSLIRDIDVTHNGWAMRHVGHHQRSLARRGD